MDIQVFSKFPRHRAPAPAGFTVDFVGHLSKGRVGNATDHEQIDWRVPASHRLPTHHQAPNFVGDVPVAVDDEIYEWIAVLESVLAAGPNYTIIELGAGHGRWSARAACAVRAARPDLKASFIAVEAEPTHFQWLREHFETNEIDLGRCKFVNAPVTGKVETVDFTIGHADEWYGQAVIPEGSGFGYWPKATVVKMTSTTIPIVIADLDHVDLIDMDIQGAELPCVENSVAVLNEKVRRLFISTHSQHIHERLLAILTNAGWTNEVSYAPLRQHDTHFGPIAFGDGAQYWVNRRFAFRVRQRLRDLFL